MKNFRRIVRLTGFIFIMILALAGGVPISLNRKAEDTNEVKIEMVESRDNESELITLEKKNNS
jgi:hypothetical protein